MSLDLAPVRAAIVAKLQTVAGIGVVHAFEPVVKDLAGLRQMYQAQDLGLRGWYVRRMTTSEVGEIYERTAEYATWRIQGYAAISDGGASELDMQALIEDMRQAFRVDYDLGGLIASQSSQSNGGEIGLQVREFSSVMFCDVLCHSVRLELSTERHLDIEEP